MALVLVVVAAAACGGGGGGSVAPGSSANVLPTNAPTGTGGSSTQSVAVSLSIVIPAKKTTSKLRPQYISPNSQSISFTLASVNGSAIASSTTQGPFNLVVGPTNPSCTSGAAGTTCTLSINAPIGTDIFTATTFSSTNGTGPLGSGAVLLSVVQNRANTANLTLTGPVQTVQLFASALTLYNGNPSPICSDCGDALHRNGRGASATHKAPAKTAATTVRRTQGSPVVSGTPTPVGPVASSSRIFVIATDVNGNQIINPTTFDINITLTLALNGTIPGQITLTDTYAGLPGEPAAPASTTADGGTVTVMAPSDNVTLTMSGTNTNSYAPSVTANYTPQGGTAQLSSPLVFNLDNFPPAAYIEGSASHVDPLIVGVPANLTDAYINTGTAATSGQLEADAYTYDLAYNGEGPGSDPSWSCTFYDGGSGYGDIQCLSNSTLAAGASLPVVLNVTPESAGYAYDDFYVSGGGAINSYGSNEAYDQINVNAVAGPLLAMSTTSSTGTFYSTVPATLTFDVWNPGPAATVGGLTLTATLPQSSTAYVFSGYAGPGWTCVGPSPTINCTYPNVLAPNGTSSTNNTTLTINVTPVQADVDQNQTWSATVNGGGAAAPATANGLTTYQQSPVYFDSAPGFNTTAGSGIAFSPGDQATLDIGAPNANPINGSVSITTQSASSGQYTLLSSSCTSGSPPISDGMFEGLFPITAGAVGVGVTESLNIFAPQTASNGPCQIVIDDVNGNAASLNIGVDQSVITVESYHRKAGSKY